MCWLPDRLYAWIIVGQGSGAVTDLRWLSDHARPRTPPCMFTPVND